MSLSKSEAEAARPKIEKVVYKFLGYSEPHLESASVSCYQKQYEKKKMVRKLARYLDEKKAEKLSEKLLRAFKDIQEQSFDLGKVKQESTDEEKTSKRRRYDDEDDRRKDRREDGRRDRDSSSRKRYSEEINGSREEAKRPKRDDKKEKPKTKPELQEDGPIPGPDLDKPSPGMLTAIQIQDMMANAQRMIEERKKQLNLIPVQPGVQNNALEDKARRAAEIQARIQAHLTAKPNLLVTLSGAEAAKAALDPSKGPTPLILDDEGRTVDSSGKAIHIPQYTPTLKANIRAKRREEFKMVLQEKLPEELSEASKFFDPRMPAKTSQRTRRKFHFVEHGRYVHMEQRLKTKAQLEKLQKEIAQVAKKTGIQSATVLTKIAPKKELLADEIPDVEWWDAVILQNEAYESLDKRLEGQDECEGITNLVEHPIQMKPPTSEEMLPGSTDQAAIPVMLTKKERRKLRRMNRRETWKEKQEKIRLELEPPPEPKVRMSNLMRVLGTEQVQDPTKIEAHVRAQMAKRQKAHEEANAARKLTKEQVRDKKIKKIKEDTSKGVHVSVYRVKDLSNPSKKFKVETNCKQLLMTGTVVFYRDCNVIVVEGGPKQQKKYRRLMLHRIKWAEDTKLDEKKRKDSAFDGKEASFINSCVLVWEGMVKERNFGEMKFKLCPTEAFAREHFRKHNVEHYWDLAYTQSIVEKTEVE